MMQSAVSWLAATIQVTLLCLATLMQVTVPGLAAMCWYRYAGELITDAEADRRDLDTYLFDLDNQVKLPRAHLSSVLWCCWLGSRKGCKKTEWWGAGVFVCLERGADLHMAQLMPLPLTVSSFSKIQIGFTFLVPAHLCVLVFSSRSLTHTPAHTLSCTA